MINSTATFQEDVEAGHEHFDPIELHAMHNPVFSIGHPAIEKMILPSKYCLEANHSRSTSLPGFYPSTFLQPANGSKN